MSAWPEAVWIVRKMRKYFNLDNRISKCENIIENLEPNLQDKIDQIQNIVDEFEEIRDFSETLDDIEIALNQFSLSIARLSEDIEQLSQTPAIFDTDVDEYANVPDNNKETSFVDNSIWFIES